MESLRISGPPEQPSTRSLQAGGLLKHGALELNLAAVSCAVENFSHFSRITFFFVASKISQIHISAKVPVVDTGVILK